MNEQPSESQQYKLLEDVNSYFNTKCCYGKKGDKVTLIKLAGEVALVERPDGQKYPVHVNRIAHVPKPL